MVRKCALKIEIYKKSTYKRGQPRPPPPSTNILISLDYFQMTNNSSAMKKTWCIPK